LQVNGWNWRTPSQVKLARFRSSKVTCFLAYVEYKQYKYKQYLEKQIMLREGHVQLGEVKRGKLKR
jgi:hypothetical protein